MKWQIMGKELNLPKGLTVEYLGKKKYYHNIGRVLRNRNGTIRTLKICGIPYAKMIDPHTGKETHSTMSKYPAYYVHGSKRIILVMVESITPNTIRAIIFGNGMQRHTCACSGLYGHQEFLSILQSATNTERESCPSAYFKMKIPRDKIHIVS